MTTPANEEARIAAIREWLGKPSPGPWSGDRLRDYRSDLRFLLDALTERDHLLDVLRHDGTEATDLARTDAFAECVAWLRKRAEQEGRLSAPLGTSALRRAADALERLRSLHRAPPSMPPDRARAYAHALADVLRRLTRGYPDDGIEVGEYGRLVTEARRLLDGQS